MTPAHTVMQLEEGKAPLSSRTMCAPKSTRKNSAVGVAPRTKVNVDSGTTVIDRDDRIPADRSTSPYLKGLFALSSLSDAAPGTTDQQGELTTAHPPLSKVYRGSENGITDANGSSRYVHWTGSKLQKHQVASSRDDLPIAGYATGTLGPQPKRCKPTSAASALDTNGTVEQCLSQKGNILPTADMLSPVNTNCDSLAHTLAHQLPSGSHSHPCSCRHSSPAQVQPHSVAPTALQTAHATHVSFGPTAVLAAGLGHDEMFKEEDGTSV